MSLDHHVYPDDYPVFNKSRQYLIKNHYANLESQNKGRTIRSNQMKITTSPGFNRYCEENHETRFSPLGKPNLTQQRAISEISNYHVSYYPTSPLNPELEEQCMFLELFRNIDKIDFRRARFKTPAKNVRKARKLKFSGDIQNFHNFHNFASKEIKCPYCSKQKCECIIIDGVSESVKKKLSPFTLPSVKNINNFAKHSHAKAISNNHEIYSKRTRRKKNASKLDYEGLQRDLLVTPLNIENTVSLFHDS